jgi:twitching motility protein PilT
MTVSPLGFKIQRVREQIRQARKDRATDVQCKAGQRTFVMVDKRFSVRDELSFDEVLSIHNEWLTDEEREQTKAGYVKTTIVDEEAIGGRARLTAGFDDNGPFADFRLQPAEIPNLDRMVGLTPEVRGLYKRRYRLVLITAPPMNAKTTLAHAYIDAVNRLEVRHIATCESPAEFVHRPLRSAISQHTLGKTIFDEIELAMSIRRRNVSLSYIGELLEVNAMRAALRAAANGLVLGTFHAMQTPGAVESFIEMFPPNERDQIRVMLAEHLCAVLGVRLIPKANEPGMVLATELLLNEGGTVKTHIMSGDYAGLVGDMTMGGQHGMHLLETSLAKLVAAGTVSLADAEAEVTRPSLFARALEEAKKAR